MTRIVCARLAGALALAGCLLAAPARGQAQGSAFAPPPGGGFGGTGEWVLSMGATSGEYFFFHRQSGGGWQIQLSPAADYFIASNISLGGVVSVGHNSDADTIVTLEPRAGFNLAISGPVGFWPLAGIAYTHVSPRTGPGSSHTSLEVFAPFLYHIVPHLFVGLGPSVSIGLSDGGNQFGIDTLLGGWF